MSLNTVGKLVKFGKSAIEVESPVQHTKFNLTKERFISKVYECCIYKHFVTYEDILKSKIG